MSFAVSYLRRSGNCENKGKDKPKKQYFFHGKIFSLIIDLEMRQGG
jgi:hypothetical protein